MVKGTQKKKTRRLKKRIRQTLGTLFLISALLIAAIPVDNLQAQGDMVKVAVDDSKSNIPKVDANEIIYTTGDGLFQFAYVKPSMASADKVAVILGYSKAYLEGGKLTIPDTVDAYLKFSDNLGSNVGYVAVGKAGNFLFYRVEEPKRDENGNIIYIEKEVPRVDENNRPVIGSDGKQIIDIVKEEVKEPKFYPCYYQDIAKWGDRSLEDFYSKANDSVSGNNPNDYIPTTTSAMQRIQAATVVFIGNQYLISEEEGKWKVGGDITNSEDGIFARTSNIVSLTVGKNLSGIGNYAFYGCGGLNSISLGNGLNTLGNSAFENCLNMQTVSLELYSNLQYIGADAFKNCQALKKFTMPIAVTEVGDSAFENCYSLEEMVLSGKDYNVALSKLGNKVFKNCSSLKNLRFPPNYTENLEIGILEGCSSLEYVTVPHKDANFKDGSTYTLEQFKDMVKPEFYFEGLAESAIHNTATAKSFAFRYLDQDVYEIIVTDSAGNKATYRVNSKNQLITCDVGKGMEDVKLPSAIGPYHIVEIGSDSFQNNCYLKKITIPSSVEKIAAGAFKGCHELKDVIFTEPVNVTSIESKAFQTQDVAFHREDCTYKGKNGEADKPLGLNPVLTFTGPIGYDCVPFTYAMSEESRINVGSQVKTYIKYYSGWPTNLVVQYNDGKVDGQEPKEGKNELIDYPTFSKLSSYTKEDYPYMTADYIKAAQDAKNNYLAGKQLTEYEQQIIDSALSIVLPQGIETIKSGLFREKEPADDNIVEKKIEKVITTNGIGEIAANTFDGCINLKEIYILGETTSIGDYAFKDCTNLAKAEISATVSSLGKRPFAGCTSLSTVDFQGGPYFTCEKSIIYGLVEGAKKSVIQCLESRGTVAGSNTTIEASELEGITELREEAFMNCKGVGSVDLKKSLIDKLSANAFANTTGLYSAYLPNTCRSIPTGAFKDSGLSYIEIPSSVTYIDPDGFNTNKNSTNYKNITFYCEDNSNAAIFAENYTNISTTSKPLELFYDVYFWDDSNNLLFKQSVPAGEDATPPEPPVKEGYTFDKWIPDYHAVGRNLDVVAKYNPNDPDAAKFTVKFVDYDDTVLKEVKVAPGDDAEPPIDPVREGHNFTGWRPSVENIQDNTTIYAQYEPKDSSESLLTVRFLDHDLKVLYTQKVKSGEAAYEPKTPVREGYTFTGWQPPVTKITKDTDTYAMYDKNGSGGTSPSPSPGTSPSPSPSPGASPTPTPGVSSKLYTLTVKNGSGSGSYVAGSQVIVIANDPAAGQEFSEWSVDPTTVTLASKTVTATVLTMPEGAVTVTANYKAKGTSTTTGSSNSSTNNSGNNGNGGSGSSGTVTKPGGSGSGGTTVVIDKNGLSNTGVVSGTVNGSSDNFVIKITESAEATEQAVKALMNEYGDLTNIKYFPMDISLYDSTGKTKITDTTGLSISITLPLPDSLITYAGNNKIAGVVDEKLDKLTPKFSTISGVSCITFTAQHFSPYVIYVDTGNLSAGVAPDDTPKTGDGIHPKWFLSIGMVCVSMVLFMKKDKKKGKAKMVTA